MADPIAYNEELMRKADFALSDLASGGILNTAQAKKFFQKLIEEAVFIKLARMKPMKSHTDAIDKITISGNVLKPVAAGSALAVADRVKPTTSQVTITAVAYKAELRLNDDVLEDNIEQKRLVTTVQNYMGRVIAKDMDYVAIQGDTTSADTLLATQDGLLKLITSNTSSAAGASVALSQFKAAKKALPQQYLSEWQKYAWLTSVKLEDDFRFDIGSRATPIADRVLFEGKPITPLAKPLIPIPQFPENLTPGNITNTVLMDPKNFVIGMWRNITLRRGYDVSAGEHIFVYTVRFGQELEEEDATVKITNQSVA